MPYNYAADSIHTKKLCSGLTSSELQFQSRNRGVKKHKTALFPLKLQFTWSSINTNRKSTTRFPISRRWTLYVTPKPLGEPSINFSPTSDPYNSTNIEDKSLQIYLPVHLLCKTGVKHHFLTMMSLWHSLSNAKYILAHFKKPPFDPL